MEDEDNNKYKYCYDINTKIIRICINNPLDVWCWKHYKTKSDKWLKLKVYLWTNPKDGYQKYRITINYKNYTLSRVIYKCINNKWDIDDSSKNNIIDHKNNNSLDNRIENLRVVTQQQNGFNTNARGTTFNKKNNCWTAQLGINGKIKSKSGFKTEEAAHKHYLMMKKEYHIII